MPRLCFLRTVIQNEVKVLGVKQVEDPVFYRLLGTSQNLSNHPIRVQNQLRVCKTKRTSPISMCDTDYKAYVQDGRFVFRGRELEKGKSLFA